MTLKRRTLLALAVSLLWAASALAQDPQTTSQTAAPPPAQTLGKTVRVDLATARGVIVLELYPDKAPVTVANFLKYVKGRRFDGIDFYRAVRTPGAPDTGFIQGGPQGDPKRVLPPIRLEPTSQTGLHHQDGTITMARLAPNSATGDFVIMVGPNSSYMDANPAAPGDNLGYAAFGQVVGGMDVVKAILALPSEGRARNPVMKGQILDPPVKITSVRVEP